MTSRASGISVLLFISAFSLTAAAQPAPPANPISQALRSAWTSAKTNFRRSADVMPEAKYGFKPVEGVRSYGAILAHVAGAAYEFCAAAKGEKTPHAEDEFEKSAKTKAEIVKALDGSIAYCDEVYKTLDDNKAAQMAAGAFGGPQAARAANLIGNTNHVNEHYGNLVTYLRINGLVPPSSAPR
ncbi:MAG TPA: DinB family protein [Vicinamibacterales bacterium]|nr:DinB family protein [Vicinamibacterales bacterium]